MYFELGVEMFSRLDAEFALIIYDARTNEFIAARDPIGIRPLYYGHDKYGDIIFASEPKNLVGLTDKIMPFPRDIIIKTANSLLTPKSITQTNTQPISFPKFLKTFMISLLQELKSAFGRRQGRILTFGRTRLLACLLNCR